ncbi:MAG: hypothetical protein R3C03_03320 [Pirellulaceae bacterium]
MDFDVQLENEVRSQLNDDILSFGWMCQIARLQNPLLSEQDSTDAVIDCLMGLHKDGLLVIGTAFQKNGMVLIDAWMQAGEELRKRMTSEIAKHIDSTDRDFCFWAQLSDDHAR